MNSSFLLKGRAGEKGVMLITLYGMVAVMSVLSLALFSLNSAQVRTAERNQNKIVAFNMAEAATDVALSQLTANPAYAGTGYVSMSSGTMQGGYSVVISTPAGFPDNRLIQAAGFAPDNAAGSRAAESRAVTAYAIMEPMGNFDFAVFSKDGMQINGDPVVDSYDSRLGAYGNANAAQNGDIGTDSIGLDKVGIANTSTLDIIGNAIIKGDVQVGPGGDPNVVIDLGPHAVITGTKSAATSERNYQPIEDTSNPTGQLKLSGSTIQTLGPGTYHYTSFSISGQAQLVATGPVKIYVDGDVSIGGNGISTSSNQPPNFLLFTSGSDVSISGNGNFYGAIYAPKASVSNTGNGAVYGAMVTQTYHQTGNAPVHYDEALKEAGGSADGPFKLVSWREENTAAWGTGTAAVSDAGSGG